MGRRPDVSVRRRIGAMDISHVLDTGNMVASNFALDASEVTNSNVMEHTRELAQHLVEALFALPPLPCDTGRLIKLPAPTTIIPREKAPPKPKPLTRWQEYAIKKNIKPRRKLRRKFDEDLKEWIPTYGYGKRDAEKAKNWVKEVPLDYKPKVAGGDPFLDEAMDRKARVTSQKQREEANKRRSQKIRDRVDHMGETIGKLATASYGRFDKKQKKKK
eukprot:NODE_2112_length_833_cov_400.426020_g1485_i0.p1 GENE.NODE_2112_length_833_cov_400.426020_g1485_i0~~NODE_2112_length_833_cov_400.426020_g1485_i0.p1  ORF type:complete len:227 (-),score=69.43 NODE_2112_length_833_cov_400.426020_g1485_i0:152-802(-)